MEKFGLAKRSSATASKSVANAQREASSISAAATATIPTTTTTTKSTNSLSNNSSSNNISNAAATSSAASPATPSTSATADVTRDDDVRRGITSSPGGQAAFLNKVRQASEAVGSGDFRRAVQAYGEAIQLDPSNHILFTNRAAALFKLSLFADSVKDARAARDLNPKWAKAYLREGVALQQLGHHGDALAAFAAGLAQEPSNSHLLSGLTDTALKSPLREKFQATFQQLDRLRLGRSPFVLMAVVGQELLAATHYSAAVAVLESALQVGTPSLKLRGSVFSALASAQWGLGALDKAIYHMQQDLAVAKSLGDQEGECRAYGNLGSAFFSKGQYKESLTHHRFQLVLAMRLRHRQTAAAALSSLGHVYTAIGDYPNALASHKQCVLLLKQSHDQLSEAREIGNVGAVYLAMGNFASAVECHQEHRKMARALKSAVEEARAFSNLGSAYHYKRQYDKALTYHQEVLRIAEERGDKTLEARAYAGLGHAARCASDLPQAKHYHEKQLDNALQTKDRVAEARACANLGIIFHQLKEFDAALKLHRKHLELARALGDKGSQGRALGNMGNAYSALNKHTQAVKFHQQALQVAQQVHDCHSQGSTHGNLAVAYQALGMYDKSLQHYLSHLAVARELKDMSSEARALCNLGNFHCARGGYAAAVPFYDQYLVLSKELKDAEGESKACFNLGYAHFSLANFPEAERYYQQDLGLARDRKDRLALARAYCNLGLARKALGSLDDALECQQKCLRLMDALRNTQGKFRALGNIGDLMLKMGDTAEAVKIYGQQVRLAQQAEDQELLATAKGALGHAHRLLGQHDRALACHTQELTIRQELGDLKGECCAHGQLGHVHTSMGNYLSALKCYQEMLERARDLGSHSLEGQACGNMGISKMNLGQLEDAIGFFEQQLAMLEQQAGPANLSEKARAFANLGDCYEALGDFEEAVKWHEQCLVIAQQLGSLTMQDKAYRGLGNAHKAVGNLQQALVCFEKRLYVAHQLNSCTAKASAYGELGCLHSLLGNFEQAVSCLEQQLGIAKEMRDQECESDAACGLGGVYQQMGEYETALKYHRMDLHIAETIRSTVRQCRAYGNLGLSHESLGSYEEAVKHQEQHLSIAAEMNDKVAKTLAYSSLGRVHHALGRHTQAVQYLQQGLAIAEQQRRREDEAKIRHRLGLALLGCGLLEDCQKQLHVAADLFESIRRESQCSSDYKLSLLDLQTACYQALQKVLVALGRHEDALVVAERACTRAFIDLLLERQAGSAGLFNGTTMDLTPVTIDQMTSTVARQKALVLCFSVAGGSLYSWLLTPTAGLVKFNELSLSELEADADGADTQSLVSISSTSVLDLCVGQVREAMGIESHIATTSAGLRSGRPNLPDPNMSDVESEAESEALQQQLEELGGRLNADGNRAGFLAMVNRGHALNSSGVSLGSILSMASSSKSGGQGAQRGPSLKKFGGSSKSPLSTLYNCLIAPMEDTIASLTDDGSEAADLVLVLQGDLYLIPFLMLRGDQTQPFLFERFNLIIVPSVSALHNANKTDGQGRPVIESAGALVVGNPQLTPTISQHWHLKEIPGAEYEARILGELLTCRPLIGPEATKGAVLHQIEQVEVIHFASHISWRLSSIVLSPCHFASAGDASLTSGLQPHHFHILDSDDSASDVSGLGSPALSEYLLTAADILNLKLHAKLVVLNSGYTDDRAGRVNTDGVVGLTRALLSAGAQCVLFSLWPVPDSASKLLMRTLYGALQEGQPVTKALSKATKTVQSTKQFSHPANWGGWVLVGHDVRLASKVALMGHALAQILQAPASSRETIRVLLHLMEKSLQRIQQGARNPMYTTVTSIENKVCAVPGWKELLHAVGFRFEPAAAGLPPAVFFPQSDPSDRLTQASASLQAILGLPASSVTALSKFIASQAVGEALIQGMREILSKLSAKEGGIDMLFNVELWHVSGCHEFLASLGLDLVAVGAENVTLRLSKQAVRRHLQFALQALVAVFNTQDAPRTLSLDNSSSLESLSSCHSASSPSSTSLSSPTPGTLSPLGRGKRSLFNPAEMERMRHSHRQQFMRAGEMMSSSPSPTTSSSPRSPLLQDPAMCLSHQSRIRSLYGSPSSTTTDDTTTDRKPPLSSPSQDDSDSLRSAEVHVQRTQSVLRSSSSDSVTLKSVKFAEDLVTEQLFDPAGPRSESDSDADSVTEGRTASQLRQHFERLSVGSRHRQQASVAGGPRLPPAYRKMPDPENEEWGELDDAGSGHAADELDPEDIALKVLADVASQRTEVELMQRHSAAVSQDNSRRLRQLAAAAATTSRVSVSSGSGESLTHHLPKQQPVPPPRSLPLPLAHSKLITTATSDSKLVTTATSDSKVTPPPPYAAPPSYCRHSPSPTGQGLVRGGSGGRSSLVRACLQSGENSISSDNSEGADSNLQSSVSSGYHSENSQRTNVPGVTVACEVHSVVVRPVVVMPSAADRYLSTRDFVNHSVAGAFAKAPAEAVASPSPFQPAVPKPPSPLIRTTTFRPDSTNSLSSQYSTSSSTRSVIYRPLGPAIGTKGQLLAASSRHRVSPTPDSSLGVLLQGDKASISDSEPSDLGNSSFEDVRVAGDCGGAVMRSSGGSSRARGPAARCSAGDGSTYNDGGGSRSSHEEELRAASVGFLSRVRMASTSVSLAQRGRESGGQARGGRNKASYPYDGDRSEAVQALAPPGPAPAPAVPPRQPLPGKDSIPLKQRGGRASPRSPDTTLGAPAYGRDSGGCSSGHAHARFSVNSIDRRAAAHGRPSTEAPPLYHGPDQDSGTRSWSAGLQDHSDSRAQWTEQPAADSQHGGLSGQAARQTSMPLFLDKDRRSIAKSAVLQSSKC